MDSHPNNTTVNPDISPRRWRWIPYIRPPTPTRSPCSVPRNISRNQITILKTWSRYHSHFPDKKEIRQLCDATGLTKKQVGIWMQNTKRQKYPRRHTSTSTNPSSPSPTFMFMKSSFLVPESPPNTPFPQDHQSSTFSRTSRYRKLLPRSSNSNESYTKSSTSQGSLSGPKSGDNASPVVVGSLSPTPVSLSIQNQSLHTSLCNYLASGSQQHQDKSDEPHTPGVLSNDPPPRPNSPGAPPKVMLPSMKSLLQVCTSNPSWSGDQSNLPESGSHSPSDDNISGRPSVSSKVVLPPLKSLMLDLSPSNPYSSRPPFAAKQRLGPSQSKPSEMEPVCHLCNEFLLSSQSK